MQTNIVRLLHSEQDVTNNNMVDGFPIESVSELYNHLIESVESHWIVGIGCRKKH